MSAVLPRIGYVQPLPPDPLALALRQGRLAEAATALGFALVQRTESGIDSDASVPLLRSGPPLAALRDLVRGRDTRLLGIVAFPCFQAVLVAARGRIANLADLQGGRLGIPASDGHPALARCAVEARRGLTQALLAGGLEGLSAAVLVEIGGQRTVADYGSELAALAAGEVDAVWVAGLAGWRAAHTAGVRILVDPGHDPDHRVRAGAVSLRLLTADAVMVERQPELLRRLVASISQAGASAAIHPAACLRQVAAGLSASLAEIRGAFGADLPGRLVPSLDQAAREALAAYVEGLRLIHHSAESLIRPSWISPGFLPAGGGDLRRLQQRLATG